MFTAFTRKIILLSFVLVSPSWAAEAPGTIPLKLQYPPATDLVRDGRVLPITEAESLRKGGLDLSTLNPSESDIWKDTKTDQVISPILVQEGETVNFDSFYAPRTGSGNSRFIAFVNTPTGKKAYTFMFSKMAHNMLLRRALLAKLGYHVQPAHRLAKVTVHFSNRFESENFLKRIWNETFGNPTERWLVSKSKDEKDLTLQDVIVTVADLNSYNLAVGFIPNQIIQGRRVLNALLVPFALAYVPESVNLFSWRGGMIINDRVKLPCESCDQFSTSREDAYWIMRRLLKLDRADFEQIAASVGYPAAVSKIVVEKLISRRNSLRQLFNMEGQDLAFDPKVSLAPDLIEGKLQKTQKDHWTGYGSFFSYGDPESPLSSSEMPAYFKSEAFSMALSAGLSELSNLAMYPNIQNAIAKKQTARAQAAIDEFIKTGQPSATPFGLDHVVFGHIQMILSRDIVTGSYMGSDQLVQASDTIGVSVDAGVYLSAYGLNPNINVTGNSEAFINRIYQHLRPVKSIEGAWNTPFKNMLVPMIKRQYGSKLDLFIEKDPAYFKTKEGQQAAADVLEEFDKDLQPGESLVITDSVGAGIQAKAESTFYDLVDASAKFLANQIVISRLHIYRSDANTIQIYKDLGTLGTLGIAFEIDAVAPVLKIQLNGHRAHSSTKFYSLNIQNDDQRNPEFLKSIQAIRSVLLTNSTEMVDALQKPYLIEHGIRDKTTDLSILLWRWRWQDTNDILSIQHPTGATKSFVKQLTGERTGSNYQDFAIDAAAGLIKHFSKTEIDLSRVGSSDPASTLYGNSKIRTVEYQAEIKDFDGSSRGKNTRQTLNVVRHWKGWKASSSEIQEILEEINNRAGKPIFPALALQHTEALELYDVSLAVYIYEKGLDHLLNLDPDDYRKLIDRYLFIDPDNGSQVQALQDPWKREDLLRRYIYDFQWYQRQLKDAIASNKVKKVSNSASQLVSYVENNLKMQGLIEALGGVDNLYVFGSINGFREKDEAGDQPILSDAIGHIGSSAADGPLNQIRSQLGINNTEFLSYWLLDRL